MGQLKRTTKIIRPIAYQPTKLIDHQPIKSNDYQPRKQIDYQYVINLSLLTNIEELPKIRYSIQVKRLPAETATMIFTLINSINSNFNIYKTVFNCITLKLSCLKIKYFCFAYKSKNFSIYLLMCIHYSLTA